jgi:hypothetical protein
VVGADARTVKHRAPPAAVYLAVYTCGAFRVNRTAKGAEQTGREHAATCCARGGHRFEVIAYLRSRVAKKGAPAHLRVIDGGQTPKT